MNELKSDIEIFTTKDGSKGLYNKALDEIYHDRNGAKKEAYEKFIEPCFVLKNQTKSILDICYGIGYNTKTALFYLDNIKSIDCVEIDPYLVQKSIEFEFSKKINETIQNNLKNPDFIHFFIEDIRNFIPNCNKKYTIIFHDGFSPNKQSEVWSEDLIKKIIDKLCYDGVYVTYNKSKPVLKSLLNQGLIVGKTIKKGKHIGTIASFNKNLIKNPLNEIELGELETKSAITYKDKNLNLSHNEIILNRKKEIEKSALISLSHYKHELKSADSTCSRDYLG